MANDSTSVGASMPRKSWLSFRSAASPVTTTVSATRRFTRATSSAARAAVLSAATLTTRMVRDEMRTSIRAGVPGADRVEPLAGAGLGGGGRGLAIVSP